MYHHNSWRRFAHAHAIGIGYFIVFKYNGHNMLIHNNLITSL
jgi:hypothetical protein